MIQREDCHNRDAADGHWMQDGWIVGQSLTGEHVRVARMIWVQFRNSRECGYDNKSTDNRCEGCKHAIQQTAT